MFALATNACENDDLRLATTVPHWLRVFGSSVAELVIVVDEERRSNRMAEQRITSGLEELWRTVERLRALDPRIRAVPIDRDSPRRDLNRKWFRHGDPVRCQAGSPIYAYLRAIEEARSDLVVKLDCDMLFHDAQWVTEASRLLRLGRYDLVEPSRVGGVTPPGQVSTRVFMLDKRGLAARRLPLDPYRLDPLRRIHRRLRGRPTWLALELMLSRAVRRGHLTFHTLPPELGRSLHVATRDEFAIPGFDRVVTEVEAGHIPVRQTAAGPNFERSSWQHVLAGSPAV